MWDNDTSDSAFMIRKINGVKMSNVSVKWTEDSSDRDYDVTVTDSENVVFDRCDFSKGINEK